MARPKKTGLEYFPLDVDIASDEKIEYLEGETGIEGFGIYIKLLAAIYRNGYFIPFTKTQLSIYSRRFFVDKNTLSAVVSVCKNIGLFDEDMFSRFNVLTSHGIQTRYLLASERRQAVDIIQEFCLLDAAEIAKNKKIRLISAPKTVIAYKNPSSHGVNVDNNPAQRELVSAENPQSKVKESIYVVVDKHTRAQETPAATKDSEKQDDVAAIFDTFSNNIHPITGEIEADMLADLLEHFGKEWTVEAIKETALNHGTSVKYVKSILENWERNGFKAKKKGRNGNGRISRADEEAGSKTTAGLERLKKDMEYADAHTVHPWDVPDGDGGNRGA